MQLTVMEIESGESPFTGEVAGTDHLDHLMMMAVTHSRLITPVAVIIEDDNGDMMAYDPTAAIRATIVAELESRGQDAGPDVVEIMLLNLISEFLTDLDAQINGDQ